MPSSQVVAYRRATHLYFAVIAWAAFGLQYTQMLKHRRTTYRRT